MKYALLVGVEEIAAVGFVLHVYVCTIWPQANFRSAS